MDTPILYPSGLTPEGRVPLVMLHGYGSNEADLYQFANELPRQYFPISLRGFYQVPFGGYGWYPLYINPGGSFTVNETEMKDALYRLKSVLDSLKRRWGFKSPFTLMGFSQGSIMSYLLMSHFPAMFDKIVAFSGYIHEPLMSEPAPALAARLEVFASHGIYDDIIPVELARRISPWLSKRHIRHVYREYPAGHTVSAANWQDALDFLRRGIAR